MTGEPDCDRQEFTKSLIRLYLSLPETPQRAGRIDWILANHLFDRKIPIETIKQAMMLASVRRLARPPEMPRLAPIRSLNYFVPVIEELLEQPLPDGYAEYLERKVVSLTQSAGERKAPSPALDQISTLSRDR